MRGIGRRPGRPDTRGEIVQVARQYFQEVGYAEASLRGIAARAGVDPSLVHHYFPGGKAELFAEALQFSRDPRLVVEEVADLIGPTLDRYMTAPPAFHADTTNSEVVERA